MTVKTKYMLTSVLFVILCLIALLAVVTLQETPTANAVSMVTIFKTRGVMGTFDNPYLVGTPEGCFDVTIQGTSGASETGGTLENDCVLNWYYCVIKVETTNRYTNHKYFKLEKDGVAIYTEELSGKYALTLYSGALNDGEYVLTYTSSYKYNGVGHSGSYNFRFRVDRTAPINELKAGGGNLASGGNTSKNITYTAIDPNFSRLYYKSPTAVSYSSTTANSYSVEAKPSNSGWWYFYATDAVGNTSAKVSAYMDCVPPNMTLSKGMSFGTTVGNTISVSATDEVSTCKLYIKFESEEWFSNGNTYTIPDTERNGRYYFYAEDGNGNRTETSWIVLSTEEPSGSLIKSDSDNSVKFVWDNEYWSATLDGKSYTEGRIISNEGEHEIVLSNNANKTKKYMFKIDHCYKAVSQTPATCIKNGAVKYECSIYFKLLHVCRNDTSF